MKTIKNLSRVFELNVEGTDKVVRIDFSDKRMSGNILRLVKKYQGIEDELNQQFKAVDDNTELSELDRLLAYTEIEENVLTAFKDDVDKAFNTNITEQMFGDTLPGVERYAELFQAVVPFIMDYKQAENDALAELNKLYEKPVLQVVEGGSADV